MFVQLFSYLANKNTKLLASLASVLKNNHTPASCIVLSTLMYGAYNCQEYDFQQLL
jgi:hypothetical protein